MKKLLILAALFFVALPANAQNLGPGPVAPGPLNQLGVGTGLAISGGNLNVNQALGIVGGTVDNSVIGGTTPAKGTFTQIDLSGGTCAVADYGFYKFSSVTGAYCANGSVPVYFMSSDGSGPPGLMIGSGTRRVSTDAFGIIESGNQRFGATISNASASGSVTAELGFGNSTSATEANLKLNGHGSSGGNGIDSFTIDGKAGVWLATNGTNAIGMAGNGAVAMPGLATSSAAQTGTVCSGTGGNLTVDTTTGCLASLEGFKNITGRIFTGLWDVMRLRPFWFSWKDGTLQAKADKQVQPGLGAHATEAVDRRLVAYDGNGELKGVRYQELTAVLVSALQELLGIVALLALWNVWLTGKVRKLERDAK